MIYTIHAIESLNYSLPKVLRNRGPFPNDEAIQKTWCLVLQNASNEWKPADSRFEGSAQSIRHFIPKTVCQLEHFHGFYKGSLRI